MDHITTPAELDANRWASCGPAALAALLRRPLAAIRLEAWDAIIRPDLARSYGKKATGAWWLRATIEVTLLAGVPGDA